MVIHSRRGMAPLVLAVVGALAVVVITLTVAFWPRGNGVPPVGIVVLTSGTPTAGATLTYQVTVTSDKPREVTLVAELFNQNNQLVNIVREDVTVDKGESIVTLQLKLPIPLPQGRYIGRVTARYEQSKLVKQDISVRVLEPEDIPTSPAPVVVNVTPSVPASITPAPTPTPDINTTPPATSQPPAPIPDDEGITLEDITEIAKTDPSKALAACSTMPDAEKTGCVSRVAAATKDETVCAGLASQYDRDKCYVSVASAGQTQACSSVEDTALRATCEAVSKFYSPGAS